MAHRLFSSTSVLLIVLGFAVSSRSVAQNCPFYLGPDTILCNGGSILLSGPPGALSYLWQDGGEAQMVTADMPGTYWCTATLPVLGQNQVVNGDFSDGDTGFTTDLVLGFGGTWGMLSSEGTYAITTDINLVHSNFPSCGDHTGGGGNMLVLNGAPVDNANIWCQTITVQPNTTYAFSAWLMSASPQSPAILDFDVNGVGLADSLLATTTTCVWNEFYALWESGAATTATICITNQNLATSGNDFALDDISFIPLCSYTDSIDIVILPPAPGMVISGAEPICPGSSVTLNAQLDPAGWALNDMVFAWSNGAAGSSLFTATPGSYEATATGRCLVANAAVIVEPDTCLSVLTMPNVFTPNGDGYNDVFLPTYFGEIGGYTLEIFNRWGQEVYTSTNVNRGWDGKIEGTVAPAGTYYWILHYRGRDEQSRMKDQDITGHVTLLGIQE